MEEKHRRLIVQNLDYLMQNIVLNDFLPHVEEELFPKSLLDEYKTGNKPENERKRQMILDVRKRGPNGLGMFIKSLVSANQFNAAKRLDPDLILPIDATDSKGSNFGSSGEHYSMPLEEVIVKQAVSVMVPKNSKELAYKVMSNPKGLALLIVNKKYEDKRYFREGANIDCDLWHDLFKGLGYEVILNKDLTKEEMEDTLNKFSKDSRHSNLDSCIVAISSHGEQDQILCSDMGHYPLKKVFEKFNNFNCEALKGRPKLFFIQACRGEALDDGVMDKPDSRAITVEINDLPYIPTFSDMIISHSTIEGYVSHRNHVHGSWFVEIMCRTFMDNAWNTSLDTMLKMVQREMSSRKSIDGEKQMCEIVYRGWYYDFYFNPGLYS